MRVDKNKNPLFRSVSDLIIYSGRMGFSRDFKLGCLFAAKAPFTTGYAFGSVIVNTPFLYSVVIADCFTGPGSVIER